MNVVSSGTVWFCYYTDFPLVKIVGSEVKGQWLRCDVKGSRALAVKGDRVLFAGDYGHRDRLHLVSLTTMEKRDLVPLDGRGDPISFGEAFGRGERLYLVTGSEVFLVEVPT